MTLIRLRDVYLSYTTNSSKVDIFNKFNFEVETGEFLVIMGPSGSGKTSLLNLIAGFLNPIKGKIFFENRELNKLSNYERAKFRNEQISMIFQFFNLIPELNARDNIALPLRISGYGSQISRTLACEKLVEVGLSNRWHYFPAELSGGEQQRVAIARALVNKPQVVLADEPTGNLDKQTTNEILDLMSELHSKGRTFIIATHDEEVAKRGTKILKLN